MIELNLLPDVKKEFIKAQKTRNTVITIAIIVTIASAGLTVLLATIVYGGQVLFSRSLSDGIASNYNKLKAKPEINKYLTVQNQLKNLDALHDSRYEYSRAFDYLQKLNPSDPNTVGLSQVTFTKESNTIEIQGTTVSFEALNTYKSTLESAELTYTLGGDKTAVKLFNTVDLTEANVATVANRKLTAFKIIVTYPPEAFLSTIKDIDITVPKLTTSDADQNAPRAVFGSEALSGGTQ